MRNTNKTLLVLILAGMLALLVSGCEKQSRYQVLTFFFTGVPPIDGTVAEKKADDKKIMKRKKRSAMIPKVFIHGPKAAGECFYCHNTDSTQSFRSVKRGGGMPSLGDITPGRLAVSPKDLCVQCHTSKSTELRFTEGLWVHGPLSGGSCNACHDYHQTVNRYMLHKESSIELCTQCHAKGYIMQTKEHVTEDECISCHNPHVGENRLLLRKDFDEVF
jgi:predicted CXXCH cytochrome family protein